MSKSKSTTSTSTAEKSPRKPRVARDHSNDYSFFMMQNVPGNSVIAVRRDKTVVAVYSVDDDFHHAFSSVPEKSMAFNVMVGSIKQRGGLESFATLTSAGEISKVALREVARSLFLTQPAEVQFMKRETAPTAEVAPEIPANGHVAHEGISTEQLAERQAEMRAEDAITGFDA